MNEIQQIAEQNKQAALHIVKLLKESQAVRAEIPVIHDDETYLVIVKKMTIQSIGQSAL